MSAIPTRRLLVYVVAGVVVLVVGTVGLVAIRGDGAAADEALVVQAGSSGEAGVGGDADGGTGGIGETGEAGSAGDTPASDANPAAPSQTTTTEPPLIFVQVVGAVRRPGVYQVRPDARVFQAVLEAGGFTEEADQQAIAQAAPLSDGCRVYVPRVGEAVDGSVESPTQSSAGVTGGSAAPGSSGAPVGGVAGPVSLNSASLEELDSLPGIGPALAQQIISYRESQGPFQSVDQLTEVPGIGPAKLEQLRPLVGL